MEQDEAERVVRLEEEFIEYEILRLEDIRLARLVARELSWSQAFMFIA